MQLEQAIMALRQAGELSTDRGRIRYRGPAGSATVSEALTALRQNREQAIAVLERNEPDAIQERLETALRGKAIELWSDGAGERFWLVADEPDADRVAEPRGRIYTAAEARMLIAIADPTVVREVHQWKRATNAVVASVEGVPRLGTARKD